MPILILHDLSGKARHALCNLQLLQDTHGFYWKKYISVTYNIASKFLCRHRVTGNHTRKPVVEEQTERKENKCWYIPHVFQFPVPVLPLSFSIRSQYSPCYPVSGSSTPLVIQYQVPVFPLLFSTRCQYSLCYPVPDAGTPLIIQCLQILKSFCTLKRRTKRCWYHMPMNIGPLHPLQETTNLGEAVLPILW